MLHPSFARLLFLFALLCFASTVAAQDPGSGGPTPTPPVPPTAIPLDGGAAALLAGGVALGIKKLRQR